MDFTKFSKQYSFQLHSIASLLPIYLPSAPLPLRKTQRPFKSAANLQRRANQTSSFCISYFGSGTRQKPISSSYFKNVEITTSCEHPRQFATSRILLVSPKQEVNCHSSNIGSKQPCLVLFKLRLVLAACREKMDVRPSRLVLAGERAGTRVVSHPQLLVRAADTASGSTVPPCCQCKVLSQEKLELLAFAGCMIRSAGNAPVIFALLPMLISRAVSFIGPSQAN